MHDIVWIDPTKEGDDRFVTTPWMPTGQPEELIDLAAKARAERGDVGREPPHKPPMGEIGSMWDRYRVYAYYEGGKIFLDNPTEVMDLEDMIRRDGRVNEIEKVLTLPLRRLEWTIEGAKGDTGECEFVREALLTPAESGGMSTPFETIIGQMTSARLYKRAHFEKVWKVGADGKVRYDAVAYRMPMTCYLARLASNAAFAGFMQWTWSGLNFIKVIIPAKKAFVYLHGEHRNPLEGISDLEVAWQAWQSKQKLRFLWYQFLELQAAGRVKAQVATNDRGEANLLAQRVAHLRGAGTIGLTANEDVSMIETAGNAGDAYAAAMSYLDAEISHSVLAGFLDLSSIGTGRTGGASFATGSYALAESLTEFFDEATEAVAKEMDRAFTHGVIADLVRYNFGTNAAVPHLTHSNPERADTSDATVALLQALAAAPTPSPSIPAEFTDQLVVKVADLLNLDATAVAKAVLSQPPPEAPAAPGATPEGAKLHASISRAHALVAAANGKPAIPESPPR